VGVIVGLLAAIMAPFRSSAASESKAPERNPALDTAIKSIPFEHFEVAGSEAMSTWTRLRHEGRGWPVVIGDDESLTILADHITLMGPKDPKDILAAASRLQHPNSLHALKQADASEAGYQPEVGDWPETPPPETGLALAYDFKGNPLPRVHILLIPVKDGSDVPAYLSWGGWNECPSAEYHVAALRSWARRYGAELVGLGYDTMIVRVNNKPPTREAGLDLAREHFLYCEDIVLQGTETLAPLAAALRSSDWWFFWWD